MLGKMQKGSSTFVTFSIKSEKAYEIDNTSVSMINCNRVKSCFAPVQLESLNGVYSSVLLDVTGMITLDDFASKNMTQDVFRKAMENLLNAIDSIEEYMLDETQILLETEYVYINPVDYRVMLLCVPVKNMESFGSVYELVHSFVERSSVIVRPNEHSYFNSVWNVVREGTGFSVKNVRMVLSGGPSHEGTNGGKLDRIAENGTEPLGVMTVQPAQEKNKHIEMVQPISSGEENEKKGSLIGKLFGKKEGGKLNSGLVGLAGLRKSGNKKTEEPAVEKEQSILTPVANQVPVQPIELPRKHTVYLVKVSTGERIEVNKPQFLLGREIGAADYCIRNNMSIGRRHATILVGQGGCEIVDHQSKNHTYLNGQAIEPDRCIPIHNGAVIRLANEEFKFFEEF